MTPYLEGLSLSLIVSDWDSDDQLELVSAIGSVQYSYFDASDPTFDAIVREWAPGFRARFNALTSGRQTSVRKLLEKFEEGATGTPFARFLLAVIDGRK